jgi:hypothetical protein
MMRLARTSIILRAALAVALVSAAACAPRSHEPLAIVPVTEVCDTIVTDLTGPPPRVPEVESIAPGRGAMIGVAMDAQMGYALGRTVIHFTGRSENWVLTDSVGRFVMNELPPGLYLLDAVRIGYRHAYFTATVRRGQVTAVALPLRKEVCGIVWSSLGTSGSLPRAQRLPIDGRGALEDGMRERAE